MQDFRQHMIENASKKYQSELTKQLIKKLELHGYLFRSDYALESFLRNDCRIEKHERTKLVRLYANDTLIAEWYDTVETKIEWVNGMLKATMICGKPCY